MLAAAVDIRNWLRKDRQTPYSERLGRDREIGLSLAVGTDHERVLAWWSRVSSDAGESTGERLESLRRLASVGLFDVQTAARLQRTYREFRRRLHHLTLNDHPPIVDDGELTAERDFVAAVWDSRLGPQLS